MQKDMKPTVQWMTNFSNRKLNSKQADKKIVDYLQKFLAETLSSCRQNVPSFIKLTDDDDFTSLYKDATECRMCVLCS